MLESFKSFFGNQGSRPDLSEVSAWARRRGHVFKRARDAQGFAIDGALEGRAWRLEWGPPQRSYIAGHELRMRIELGLPGNQQMLLLSRPLMDALESQAYERFTHSNETAIGTAAPEEMRWLVMFPKIELRASKTVHARFGGVSGVPADGLAWTSGALGTALARASRRLLVLEPPFALMTLRGRAYLRLQLMTPDPDDTAEALVLFETAATEALRVAATRVEPSPDWAPSANSAWQSLHPDRRGDPKVR